MENIKVVVDYETIKEVLYIEEVVVIVEQVRELKSAELDPSYYDGIFELTCGEKISVEFYYNGEVEDYEIRVKLVK